MWNDARKAIADSSHASSVYIGCDSQRFKKNGDFYCKYTTVIIVHRDSHRGAAIFYRNETQRDFGNLKQKLLNEVQYALMAFDEISDVIDGRHLEIHLDLNRDPRHKSNVALNEAIGWVRGATGIDPKVKPEAWAAAHAADHVVRSKGFFSHGQ